MRGAGRLVAGLAALNAGILLLDGRPTDEFPGSDWCGVTGVGRPGARAVADGCVALYGVPVHGAMLEACIFVGSQRPPWAPTSVTSAMTSFWSKRLPEIAKLVHRRRPTDSVALAEPVRAAREFFLGLDTRGADGATRPLTWQLRAARSALLMHEEDTERVLQFLAALDAAIASHHFRNEFAASEARRELEAARILLPRSRDPQAEWDRIQKEMLETCEICLERARIKHGLVCAKGHFACRDCTERNLKVLAEPEERARLEEDGHLLRCYKPQCLAPPFSLKELAGIVSEECFKAYMAAMKLKVESRIIAEQRRAYQAELERERRILAEGKVASFHAGCIAEEILTLTCPKCRLAYHIADGGCAALKCSSCKAAICFWCGAYCGHDAHRHVRKCPQNAAPGQSIEMPADFEAALAPRRIAHCTSTGAARSRSWIRPCGARSARGCGSSPGSSRSMRTCSSSLLHLAAADPDADGCAFVSLLPMDVWGVG